MTTDSNLNDAGGLDPHAWLEEVEGQTQLDWVRQRNAKTAESLETERFSAIRDGILEVLDAKEKIPTVSKHGGLLYNLWKDVDHPRGLWRRTTPESFATDQPSWEVLLDLDRLGQQEGVNWVWGGSDLLPHDYGRALVYLSRGGSDAKVIREFDLTTKSFVSGGFECQESKGWAGWADTTGDLVLVARDFGPGTLTTSGYPRSLRLWRRGTPLNDANELFGAETTDMGIWGHHDFTEGFDRTVISRSLRFYAADYYLVGQDLKPQRLDLPLSAEPTIHRQWLFVEPREDWTVGGSTHVAGSFVVIELDRFLAGHRNFSTLFTPTPSTSLVEKAFTPNHVVLNILEHVKSRLECHTFSQAGWAKRSLDPDVGAGNEPLMMYVRSVDSAHEDAVWLTVDGFLTPTTLALLTLDKSGNAATQVLKRMPTYFDSSSLKVEQHFATSTDGTHIPYFQVGPRTPTGPAPTLLYGYGGFELAQVPVYSGTIGRSWLAHGGVYVMANIRGGNEYGPGWHQAALKHNRHRAYEDFAAVAQDLVARGVTTRQQLGVRGGSNGGLLIGNMLMTYPHLFSAAVCQVPLLDMKRYSHLLAGASWMAEYGNPDIPEEWEFIKTFSPYHLHEPNAEYPPVIFTTSTRDDRVHPGHARKMAARMIEAGNDVTYYENIEGGHGGAATNTQSAYMNALTWEFLWQRLG